MARPKKATEEARNVFIGVRLRADELAEIDARAERAGMNRSDYVREMALKGRVKVEQNRRLDPATVMELKRIGVNLNQLVRKTHIRDELPPGLPDLCEQIEAVVMEAVMDGPEDSGEREEL